jgi:O-antigen/teichoic acid export membrane protein
MYKGIKKNSFLSGAAVYLFANILSAAIPFVLLPVLTRYLTPAEYGEVAVFQTILGALGAFLGLNATAAAGVKYYDSDMAESELKLYIGNCFFVLLASTSIVLLVAVAFSKSISNWLSIDGKWLVIGVIVSCASFITLMRTGQWQVRKKAKYFGLFQVSQSLLNMLFSLLLVVYFLKGAEGRIWVLAGVPVLYALMALYLLYKDGLLEFSWRPKYLREILLFGVPLVPHAVGGFLLSSADRFMINSELGLAQVGVYMVAAQIAAALGMVFDAINNAYVPWLFERLKRNNLHEKQQIVKWTYIYCLTLIGVALMAFIVGPYLVILIAGESYRSAGEVIGWIVFGQIFNGMYLMVTNYIFFSKKTGILSLTTITSGLINIGLLSILIGLMGLKGAAMAFCISMACKFFLTWYVAQLRHPMPWFSFRSST